MLGVAANVLLVGIAQAQVESKTVSEMDETMVIIGQRKQFYGTFTDIETPAANQTIGLELIREVGAFDLDTVLDLSASVARQNNFGGLWNSFSIRGFAGDINLPSGFLVNGFNAGRGFGGPRDIVGVESVDVLKGPRAALFGRGEPGGTVNLVTKRPKFETAGEFRATYGRFEQIRLEADAQTSFGANDDVGI
ncbi:MAG: TonB-dependent receptor plug domain-containing protein, partial [Pseudomonadota bacterium]